MAKNNYDIKPPQVPEIEASILGAMMLEKEAVAKAIGMLHPESFYLPAHQKIYSAMITLFEKDEPIDTVTLYSELKQRKELEEVGGAVYLSKLSQNIPSAANIEYHAKIVLEKEILRKLITTSHAIAKTAYEDSEDAFDILDDAERKIFAITENQLIKSYVGMDVALREAMEYIETIHSADGNKFAVKTGFFELDDLLGGLQNSDLIILAARPSIGKTALALSIARNVAVEQKKATGIFTLEMSTTQLMVRLICAEAKINAHLVRTGKLPTTEGPKISKAVTKLLDTKIFIDDSPTQTVLEIRAKARRLKAEKDVSLIIIDYLQLMEGKEKSESREREISHISRSLKGLAKELNIPVLALAQLNRQIESRTEKRPQLSDLRESGAIEQDADVVMFINRPEMYGKKVDEDGSSLEGLAEVIIGKQRHGPTGMVKLAFIKENARFENFTHLTHGIVESGVQMINGPEDLPF